MVNTTDYKDSSELNYRTLIEIKITKHITFKVE